MENVINKIITGIVLTFIMIVVLLGIGFVRIFFQSLEIGGILASVLSSLITILIACVTLIIFLKYSGYRVKIFSTVKNTMFIILFCAVLIIIEKIINKIDWPKYLQNYLLLNSIISAASPGFVEEILFRGMLLTFFLNSTTKLRSIALVSLIFGLLHIGNILFGSPVTIIYILNIILFGTLFSFIYVEFGLLNAILLHWSWNSFFTPTQIEFSAVTMIPVIITIGFWLLFHFRRKSVNK